MTYVKRIVSVALALAVSACATSTPVHYLSLDDGRPTQPGSPSGLRVAVTQVNVPEFVDRPQLVVRTDGHQLRMDDQYEWAEPLRVQIPRVFARYLGEALNSGRVVALPLDAQNFELDFKVMLDIQRFEVIAGQGVELDVVWRVEARDGRYFFGRSLAREAIETTKAAVGDYANVLSAENRALQRTAKQVASGIAGWLKETAPNGHALNRNAVPADPLHASAEWSLVAEAAAHPPLFGS